VKGRLSPLFIGAQLLLLLLAVSRYDASSLRFRGTTEIDFFNWFWRYRFFGFLTFFDLIVSALVSLTAVSILAHGRWRARPFDAILYVLGILLTVSIAVRFLQRDVEDSAQNTLFQLRSYAYFAAAYLVSSRVAWPRARRQYFIGLLAGAAVLTFVLSWWEIRNTPPIYLIVKYGRTLNMRDLSDYLFVFLLQFGAVAALLEGVPRRLWQKALLAGIALHGLFSVFTGVGRGVVIVYPVVFAYFAWYYGLLRRRWLVASLAVVLLVVTTAAAYVVLNAGRLGESSGLYIFTTFRPREPAVATRLQESMNFAANLYHRNGVLLGIGLGNKWFEFWPQPLDDLGAFPPQERDSHWHLGMHLPFLRLALDFGLLGTVALLSVLTAFFISTMNALRSGAVDGLTRAFILASWAVIGYHVSMNSLAGPKMNLLTGLLLGTIAGILDTIASDARR
jgi:hypothetical protein